ncbi:MAG: 23S rRNA (pseudouridine(1915)-N(3))-methyltransferase RlmH [Firmicutes bacterium]|jgi:23S rRNA (pseudouridine1915-N3)-methyltransferase|nr:23S rRNA (pseudouridine(1915)-N(3))-methyltransferase RlmH [Bacillota bacterium]
MNLKIIAVGTVKEKYIKVGIDEYKKRIRGYGSLEVIEVKEESFKEPLSSKELEQVMEKEGKRILEQVPQRSFVIALDRLGESLGSIELAQKFQDIALQGTNQVVFIIGGALGLWREVLNRSDLVVSFSKMTFPHQLIRLILTEQIYRALTIIRGEKYHK